jgi:hypothetical protein
MGTVPGNLCTFMIISRSFLLRIINAAENFTVDIEAHILCSIMCFPKIVPFMSYCGNIHEIRTRHTRQYNKEHALCMLDNYGYRHTLSICNVYCFFTATMVTRTCYNTTLYVNCLSFFMLPVVIVILSIV